MKRKLLILALAAAGSMAVGVASATAAGHHRHDHGYKHASITHRHAIRPGFAFAPSAAWRSGGCVTDDGQGRFRSCSWGAN